MNLKTSVNREFKNVEHGRVLCDSDGLTNDHLAEVSLEAWRIGSAFNLIVDMIFRKFPRYEGEKKTSNRSWYRKMLFWFSRWFLNRLFVRSHSFSILHVHFPSAINILEKLNAPERRRWKFSPHKFKD